MRRVAWFTKVTATYKVLWVVRFLHPWSLDLGLGVTALSSDLFGLDVEVV